jgi:hypothetical protein
VQRSLTHRHGFSDAVVWMEIHGNAATIVEHWRAVLAEKHEHVAETGEPEEPGDNIGNVAHGHPAHGNGENPFGRRRRRRRRRRRHSPV